MKVGTAWADITPSERLTIQGQLYVRYGEYKHDPLTVNAVVFDSGSVRVALVSCDLCMLPDAFVREAQARCERELGLSANHVLIACTHTHLGPDTYQSVIGEVNAAFMQSLQDAIVETVRSAARDLGQCMLWAGSGYVDQMGFNRRGLHRDGTCDMYYGSWNEDFAGLEGPRDGEVSVLFATRPNGKLKVVVPSFSTHPNAVESESYYSADLVGQIRSHIRRVYGRGVGVVYLTGAAGNTAPTDLEKPAEESRHWRGERGLVRSGRYLGSEIVKVIESTLKPMQDPALGIAAATLSIPMQQKIAEFPNSRLWNHDLFRQSREEWPRYCAEHSPVQVRVNVVRIGDAAICTNPAELYVEFGLQIKKGSPARVTLISELTDGHCGYVPTRDACTRGGYSAMVPTYKLDQGAGDAIVKATRKLLRKCF